MKRHRRKPRDRPTDEQIAAKHGAACFFAELGFEHDCEPPIDLVHLIPAQRLRFASVPVWDERVWVYGCRRAHHLFDNRFIRLTRSQLPDGLEDYAREHELEGSLNRDYGPREELAA